MSTEEGGNIFSGPLSEEAKQKIIKIGRTLVAISIAIQAFAFLLVHFNVIQLYPKGVGPGDLSSPAEKLLFAFRYQTLLAFWLLCAVNATIFGRVSKVALNPINKDTEQHVEVYKNILTNSVESILISIIAQLAFVSFAGPEAILKFIPLVNIIQFFGRIAFFIGYPMRRALGFIMTLVPNTLLIAYCLIKFVAMFF